MMTKQFNTDPGHGGIKTPSQIHLTGFVFSLLLATPNIYASTNRQEHLDTNNRIDYCLDLHAGSNLVSFYALPDDRSVSNVLASLHNQATEIIGEGIAATHMNDQGWAGRLTTINPYSGYWIKTNSDASLCLSEATLIDPHSPYELHAGSNLVSFPFAGSINIGDALPDEIEGDITSIISEGVAASYTETQGLTGNLKSMEGGKGYWMTATKPITFSFNIPEPSVLILLIIGLAMTPTRKHKVATPLGHCTP